MTEVEWTPLDDFPGYSINPLGQVRKDSSLRLIQPRFNQFGVPYVGLMRDNKQYIRSLPRLVAKTFLPEPNPIFDTPINLNGDRSDCRVDNLMWRPRWYAVKYIHQFTDDPYAHPINVPVKAMDETDVFRSSLDAACHYGLLEKEVVLSVLNNTYTWPTYQIFEIAGAR